MSITADELLSKDPAVTIINAGTHPGKREIRGAIRYNPHELLDADHLALPIGHDTGVILYAEGGANDTLEKIAGKLRSEGFANVSVYGGTLADYEKAGGDTQDPSMEQVIPPSTPAA
jgi:hypothetical protein